MIKLLSIIKKDLKLLIRSKGSASIIILGPLVVILLVGLGFNTANVYKINIGTYSPAYSDLSESILEELRSDQFTISKSSSQEECISSVKNGLNHICMIIPENLAVNPEQSKSITFYVDYSRINLVYAILDSISEKIETSSEAISLQLTQSLIDVVDKTNSDLVAKRSTVGSLSSNNDILSSRLSSINSKVSSLSSSLSAPGLSESIENITIMVESSNLSSSERDYIADNLGLLEKELSDKILAIEQLKTDVNSDISSASNIIETSNSDIASIDNSIASISSRINAIGIRNAAKIVSPISTEIQPITAEAKYLNYTFPTLLVLILSFVSIILASSLVISEKTSNAFFRNTITPTSDILFIMANYLTPLIIIFVQLATILAISTIFFKAALFSQLLSIILIIFLSSTLFIMLGMFIGSVFKSGETATIASISIISLLIFFSNIILPIESLPAFIKTLANLNPVVVTETILRRAILFSSGLANLYKGMLILIAYIAVIAILLFMQYRFAKESYKIKRIMNH